MPGQRVARGRPLSRADFLVKTALKGGLHGSTALTKCRREWWWRSLDRLNVNPRMSRNPSRNPCCPYRFSWERERELAAITFSTFARRGGRRADLNNPRQLLVHFLSVARYCGEWPVPANWICIAIVPSRDLSLDRVNGKWPRVYPFFLPRNQHGLLDK